MEFDISHKLEIQASKVNAIVDKFLEVELRQ